MRTWSLQSQLAVILTVLTLGAIAAIGLVVDRVTTRELTSAIGREMRELAAQMRDKLDRSMFERYRDMAIVAALDPLIAPELRDENRRAYLANLQRTYPDYAWIGYTDPDGKVLASTGGLLEGADVSERPWFKGAVDGPFVGDVHKAVLLEKLLKNPDPGAPLRFVDVAMPLTDADGVFTGTVGAHLSWSWAEEIKRSLLADDHLLAGVEILVLSKDGDVLLGDRALEGTRLDLASIAAAQRGDTGVVEETWPDGVAYLTGYSRDRGFQGYPGLGWIVLARQPVELALHPVHVVERLIVGGGLITAAVFCLIGLWMARRVAAPLARLGTAAATIGADSRVQDVPEVGGFAEVRALAAALRTMLARLGQKQIELEAANQTLETRVAERTEELTRTNRSLAEEVAERRRVEAEREGLIGQLKQMAETDFLTGVLNRRSFYSAAERELSAARRYVRRLAVVMLDIDHFKTINDTHGHQVGDEVLKAVAAICRAQCRDSDFLARYGGEEFVLLLRETHAGEALEAAERLRAAVAAHPVEAGGITVSVTASFGVAAAGPETAGIDQLVAAADAALYRAKAEGRDRVVAAA
jgi:diguanylate cyclase (GGDEF)-like protein